MSKRFFYLTISFTPIFFFCAFLGYFALDIPQGDDFELVLNFLVKYQTNATSLTQKWDLLTAQFVEHRLLYTRLVVLLQYLLTGQVSFYGILLVGNLSLLGILFIVWRHIRSIQLSVLYLLPVVLIIFQPCYSYDGVLWPAATLAYNSVVFFALLTIHWLSSGRLVHFRWAMVAAFLCTYTFGNGVLIWGAGVIVLILQRRWKETLIWIGMMGLILGVYFYQYEMIGYRNSPLQNMAEHPLYILINFLIFLGAAANWGEYWPKLLTNSDIVSIVIGGGVLVAFVKVMYEVSRSFIKNQTGVIVTTRIYFIVGSLIFLLMTGFVLSASRLQKDEVWMHVNRYRIHSVVVLVLLYLYMMPYLIRNRFRFLGTVAACLVFWALSYFHFYNIFDFNKRNFLAGQFNWTHHHEWFIYRDTSYWEKGTQIAMDLSAKNQLFELKERPFEELTTPQHDKGVELKVQSIRADKALNITGTLAGRRSFWDSTHYYLTFKNLTTQKIYLLAAHYDVRSARLVLMGEDYYYPKFHLNFSYEHFPVGRYQIGYATESRRKLRIYWQPHFLSSPQS